MGEVAREEVTTSENRLLTRFWLRWTVSMETPVLLPSPQPIVLIFSMPPCCDQDDSIVRLLSLSPISRDVNGFSVSTPVESPSNPMSISKLSLAEHPDTLEPSSRIS